MPKLIPEYGNTFCQSSDYLYIDLDNHSIFRKGNKIYLELSFRYNDSLTKYKQNNDYGPYNMEYWQKKINCYIYSSYDEAKYGEQYFVNEIYSWDFTKKNEFYTYYFTIPLDLNKRYFIFHLIEPKYKTTIWVKYSRSINIWLIIGISVGGVVLIIIGIIIFICCRKKRSNKNSGIVNEPLFPTEQPAL